MSQTRRLRIIAGTLTIVSLAVVLAACGGGGGNNPKATATKGATQEATSPATAGGPATPVATEPAAVAATNTPAASSQKSIDVVLDEFHVTPSATSVSAGTVTFNVKNEGTVPHSFIVIKTELAADALPVNSASFTVDLSSLDVLKSQPNIATGSSAQVTLDLTAGHYVLICNVPSHYQAGSRTAFTVQ